MSKKAMRRFKQLTFRSRFLRNAKGNVAIMFSLSAIPLIMAAGAALDYMRASDTHARMEQALDAAALAVGNSPGLTNAEMKKLAIRYFRENYPNATEEIDAAIKVTVSGDRISLSIDADVPTTLLRIMGYKDIPIHISNEVMRSATNLEVALALDITGSMGSANSSNSKISALKIAAKDLVDILVADNQTNYYSKLALAPYSNSVNVGALSDTLRGVPLVGTSTTPGYEKFTFKNAQNNNKTYELTGCVTERTGTEAFTDASPVPVTAKLGRHYASSQSACNNAPIMPLSTDRAQLKSRIDALTTTGSTAGHIGVAWTWYLLSPNFDEIWTGNSKPAPYGSDKLIKAAIIMTDGLFNTSHCKGVLAKDAPYGNNEIRINCNAENGQSDAQALALCSGMKNAGITVYTVGFDLANEPAAALMLSKCASSPSHAYSATTGAELKTAFRDIGAELSQLRLSK